VRSRLTTRQTDTREDNLTPAPNSGGDIKINKQKNAKSSQKVRAISPE